MANSRLLCMGCMQEKDQIGTCPYCGFDEKSGNPAPYLPLRSMLEDRYIVGKVLDNNGEGATYIGYDTELNASVRIREYLPDGFFERSYEDSQIRILPGCDYSFNNGFTSFLNLARSLARMRDLSAILPVYDIFEENGTAYYVSENVEAITLRDFLLHNGGALNFEQVRSIFMPLLSTLSSLHAVDIIHRGISPETLLIGKDGRLRLTGFCISDARTARTDFNAQLFKGYAAIEQYGFDGQQGPWTDIYGLAATIYRTLVGNAPPEATARVTNDKMIIPARVAEELPAYVMSALANALQILPEDRTRDVEAFRDEFSASPRVTNRQNINSVNNKKTYSKRKPKNNTKKYAIVSLIITSLVVLLIIALLFFTIFKKPGAGVSDSGISKPTTQAAVSINTGEVNDPDVEEAPSLIGLMYGNVMSDASMAEFRSKYSIVIASKEISDQKRGTILKQTPAAGSKITRGDKISLVISAGAENIGMPNLVGKSETDARIALLEAGFSKDCIIIQQKYVPNMPPATVVETNPAAGSQISVDSIVTIYVNSFVPTTTQTTTTEFYGY